jgi:hypothetical protein
MPIELVLIKQDNHLQRYASLKARVVGHRSTCSTSQVKIFYFRPAGLCQTKIENFTAPFDFSFLHLFLDTQ